MREHAQTYRLGAAALALLLIAGATALAGAQPSDGRTGEGPEASAARTLAYKGRTNEGRQVRIKVERDGRHLAVTDANAGFGPYQCGSVAAPEGVENFNLTPDTAKVKGRSFRLSATGFVDGTTITTNGKFTPGLGRVTGVSTFSGDPSDPASRPCIYSSQTVTWSAKR